MAPPATVERHPDALVWSTDYFAYLANQKRVAALTLSSYQRDLELLWQLADKRSPNTLTATDIRRFIMQMHSQGLHGHSIARTLSAWRGFFRWCVRQGHAGANPVEGLRAPKSPRKLPKALSPDQADALLRSQTEANAWIDLRDHAMFELFYSSGLRLAELSGATVEGSLNIEEGLIRVDGKRGRQRLVPVGRKALDALQRWLTVRAHGAHADCNTLFVSQRGERLSPSSIRSRLALWAKKQGLGVHVHPHMLRHSFASHMLQSSGDLRAVQELLGHASIRSTQVYTHLDFQHLATVYDRAHPRARKK